MVVVVVGTGRLHIGYFPWMESKGGPLIFVESESSEVKIVTLGAVGEYKVDLCSR